MVYGITYNTLLTPFRFPNGVCVSSSQGRNGTCYAAEECSNRGGTAGGNCAGGYGVCCVCEYPKWRNIKMAYKNKDIGYLNPRWIILS